MTIKGAARIRLTLPDGRKIFYNVKRTGIASLNADKLILIWTEENEPYKTLEK